MRFDQKVAIVTGASRGIGAEIAKKLSAQGAKIVVNYSGNQDLAEAVVQDIKSAGGDAFAYQANVASAEEVKGLVEATLATYGAVHFLVNNAGITKDNLIMRMKEDEFDDVIAINLKGVFNTTKAVTRPMMKNRFGRIVNVASIVGVSGNAGQANYVAAKAGVIGLTKTTALELASRNINVNAVAPGFIQTDMTDVLPEEVKEQLLERIPLHRLGTAEDVAHAVCFLLSEEATYLTGQTLHIDGGMVM